MSAFLRQFSQWKSGPDMTFREGKR